MSGMKAMKLAGAVLTLATLALPRDILPLIRGASNPTVPREQFRARRAVKASYHAARRIDSTAAACFVASLSCTSTAAVDAKAPWALPSPSRCKHSRSPYEHFGFCPWHQDATNRQSRLSLRVGQGSSLGQGLREEDSSSGGRPEWDQSPMRRDSKEADVNEGLMMPLDSGAVSMITRFHVDNLAMVDSVQVEVRISSCLQNGVLSVG